MGELAGVLTAAGGAIAAILGAAALLLRQQRLNDRATRREIELLWQISTLEVRLSRIMRLAIERAGITLPAEVSSIVEQINTKREALNADLLAEKQREVTSS